MGLKTIMLATDGSKDSDGALRLALSWAKWKDALLVAWSVIDEQGMRMSEATLLSEGYFGGTEASILLQTRAEREAMLEQVQERCRNAGVRSETRLVMGTPHEELVDEAHRYDLVVIPSHTHFEFGWQHADDGTLHKVIQECARPVVAVPLAPAVLPDAIESPVVVAFDGSLRSSQALYDLVASGLGEGREIHVVSVDKDHEVAAIRAERAVEFLRHHALNASAHGFDGAFPAVPALMGAIEKLGAGLLVIGAFGQMPLRELILGSTTRSLLEASEVPVFCAH